MCHLVCQAVKSGDQQVLDDVRRVTHNRCTVVSFVAYIVVFFSLFLIQLFMPLDHVCEVCAVG